jgi:hypothetical protein
MANSMNNEKTPRPRYPADANLASYMLVRNQQQKQQFIGRENDDTRSDPPRMWAQTPLTIPGRSTADQHDPLLRGYP